ncbi:LOW QUALITY PROTEIN: choline transporter-like protein 3 [Thomomys bottae]
MEPSSLQGAASLLVTPGSGPARRPGSGSPPALAAVGNSRTAAGLHWQVAPKRTTDLCPCQQPPSSHDIQMCAWCHRPLARPPPSLSNSGSLFGTAQIIEDGQVEYKPLLGIRYMWWYHLIGLVWTSLFILACQQMTVAGTVATCYFNRNKNDPPDHPILSSLSILFCYHQGTIIKESFLINVTRIPRMVFIYMYNTLKEKFLLWFRIPISTKPVRRISLFVITVIKKHAQNGTSPTGNESPGLPQVCRLADGSSGRSKAACPPSPGFLWSGFDPTAQFEVQGPIWTLVGTLSNPIPTPPQTRYVPCYPSSSENPQAAAIFQHAYAAAAITGTEFCMSAKDALKILSKHFRHFTSVNCFGDFIIFLGKVLVVCVFGGLMAFNYNCVLQVWTVPLLLVAFFAYLVTHSFLSMFGTVLDTLLLCFTVDLETNDRSTENPYFMDQAFVSFVKRTQKFNSKSEQDKDSLRNPEGTELWPTGT